ncbi:MAG: bifunctional diaminohydroxyphosphoribosylaminopyrimidine deaminase/5-amino-6-(5-phosphoribosylamino)uracil reductase RibD, partial [Bacteroidetes bacterium]|nr:bifunctional diaminohydroxyphosphoribosylaminopyrimidine deaminase/5-amino-6-(5-phosphoribosylamino)uracil reductase RibD [Bacteroidota bacterium]
MNDDTLYLQRACDLATRGGAATRTNPNVGAVIVYEGRILGEGYHTAYGAPHAEVEAVRSVPASEEPLLAHSTLYVTLEPCCHQGKTPPCVDLILEKAIPRVVVGLQDPDPRVAGK